MQGWSGLYSGGVGHEGWVSHTVGKSYMCGVGWVM